MIDHGIRFVMDYNEDRLGSVSRSSRNDDTFEKDVLENNIGAFQREESATVYFQNIGTSHVQHNTVVEIHMSNNICSRALDIQWGRNLCFEQCFGI